MFVLLNKFMVPCHLIPAIFGRSYSIQSITFMHLTNFAIAKNPKSAYKTFDLTTSAFFKKIVYINVTVLEWKF